MEPNTGADRQPFRESQLSSPRAHVHRLAVEQMLPSLDDHGPGNPAARVPTQILFLLGVEHDVSESGNSARAVPLGEAGWVLPNQLLGR
jgi:hypothetical protein